MERKLFFNDPMNQPILQVLLLSPPRELSDSQDFSMFFSKKILSYESIYDYALGLSDDHFYLNLLDFVGIPIDFDFQKLPFLTFEEHSSYYTYIILHISIIWLCKNISNNSIGCLILKKLNKVIDTAYFEITSGIFSQVLESFSDNQGFDYSIVVDLIREHVDHQLHVSLSLSEAIVHMVSKSYQNQSGPFLLLSLFHELLHNYLDSFSYQQIQKVFQSRLKGIYSLDIHSLSFFLSLAKFLKWNTVKEFFMEFGSLLVLHIGSQKEKQQISIPHYSLPLNIYDSFRYHFYCSDPIYQYYGGFDHVKFPRIRSISHTFPSTQSENVDYYIKYYDPSVFSSEFRTNLSNDDQKRLLLIMKIADLFPLSYNSIFMSFSMLTEWSLSDYVYEAFLFIIIQMKKIQFCPFLISFLSRSSLFSPSITVFNMKPHSKRILQMRYTIVNSLICYSGTSFSRFFSFMRVYPMLISEIFIIFRSLKRKISSVNFVNVANDLALTIIPSYYELRNGQNNNVINIALTSVLHYFFETMEDFNYFQIYWQDEMFSSVLFFLAFDSQYRINVFNSIQKTWSLISSSQISTYCSIIRGIFDICRSDISDSRSILLIVDIMDWINSILSYRIDSIEIFSTIRVPLFQILSMLNNEAQLYQLISKTLSFFVISSGFLCMYLTERSILVNKIKEYPSPTSVDSLIPLLKSLLAGQFVSEGSNEFFIKYPCYLQMVFMVLYPKPEVFSLMISLIQFSYINIVQMHKGQFDTLLLTYIESDIQYSDEILSIFLDIAIFVSSNDVVHKFISLFCPDNGRVRSKFFELGVNTLTKLFQKLHYYPRFYLPLDCHEHQIIITDMKSIFVNRSFCFCFWLQLHPAFDIFPLIELSDQSGKLSIIIQSHSICFESVFKNKRKSVCFEHSLPFNQWFLLSIRYFDNRIIIYVDSKIINSIDVSLSFRNESLNCTIGFSLGKSIQYPPLIGSFVLTDDIIRFNFKEMGLNGIPQELESASHIFVSPKILNNRIILNIASNIDSNVSLKGTEIIWNSSFSSILIDYFKISSLVPLFAQIGLPSNGINVSISHILYLFDLVFVHSYESQVSFVDDSCWTIVSYLLSKIPDHLDYEAYCGFFDIYVDTTHPKFRKSLFNEILLNPEIWILCDTESLIRITHHWFNDLLSLSCETSFANAFPQFLHYFWNSMKDDTQSPIKLIKEHIIMTLTEIASYGMTNDDVNLLFDECLNSSSYMVSIDILKLIRHISESKSRPFMMVPSMWIYFPIITKLFQQKNSQLSLAVIETLISFYDGEIFKKKLLLNHIELIFSIIQDHPIDESFLNQLWTLSNDHPPILLLCFALLSKHPSLFYTFTNSGIQPHVKYCVHKAWAFWPLVASISLSDKINRETVFGFILSCSNKNWDLGMLILQIVSESKSFTREYLFSAIGLIQINLKKYSDAQILSLIEACIFFMFYHSSQTHNSYILNHLQCLNRDQIISQTIYERLSKLHQEISYNYSLDLCPESSEWLDAQLAKNCLDICFTFDNSSVTQYIVILASFVSTSSSDYVASLLLRYSHSQKFIRKHMQFIEYHNKMLCTKSEIDLNAFNPNTNILSFIDFFEPKRIYYSIEIPRVSSFILKFISKSRNKLLKYQGFSFQSPDSNMNVGNILDTNLQNRAKKWKMFWSRMTFDQAPWTNSIKRLENDDFCKRDNTLCAHYCPMKFKPNKSYDDHKEASLCRDTGSHTHALELIQKLKLSKVPQSIPTILEVTNDTLIESNKIPSTSITNIVFEEMIYIHKIHLVRKAILFIQNESIIISYENEKTLRIRSCEIKSVFRRNHLHRENGAEIFLYNGDSYLIEFTKSSSSTFVEFVSRQSSFSHCLLQMNHSSIFINYQPEMQKWITGEISTFQYLMFLNTVSGRTFNDASMYPVFPWVFSDYSFEEFNYDNLPLRDLQYPLGVFTESRKNDMLAHLEDGYAMSERNFLYSMCYSSPLCVYLYLLRTEPFTSLHIELQGGKFDHAARLFSSIPDTFRMVTSHMNDYRELIPEFFFSTEFLMNRNRFDLGKVNGDPVNDVELPKWAQGNPLRFVYLHRKALESNNTIEKWIDLIWGYKQKGESAKEFFNTYDPNMYENVWNNVNIQNQIDSMLVEATLRHCGQIPTQLFSFPHPTRNIVPNSVEHVEKVLFNVKESIINSTYWIQESSTVLISSTGGVIVIDQLSNMRKLFSIDPSQLPQGKANMVSLTFNKLIIGTIYGYVIIYDLMTHNQVKHICHSGNINCIDANGSFLATGGCDTVISVVNLNTMESFRVASFRQEITCCYVSNEFKAIASCSHDGYLYLIDSRRSSVSFVKYLGDCFPKLVLITHSWGFILVYYTKYQNGQEKHYINVYTINGDLHCVRNIEFNISCWCTWESNRGFDFMALCTPKGQLFAFEVFFLPEIRLQSFGHVWGEPSSIAFSRNELSIIVTTCDGRVVSVPKSKAKIKE